MQKYFFDSFKVYMRALPSPVLPSILRRPTKQAYPKTMARRQLGDNDRKDREEINRKINKIVVRVVGADEKQADGHGQQKLFGRRVLVTAIDLLPQIQVVVGPGVELKRHALHVVEHHVRSQHVGGVR
jgi:hypothetical protein